MLTTLTHSRHVLNPPKTQKYLEPLVKLRIGPHRSSCLWSLSRRTVRSNFSCVLILSLDVIYTKNHREVVFQAQTGFCLMYDKPF